MSHPPSLSLLTAEDDDWQGLTAGLTSSLTLTTGSASTTTTPSTSGSPTLAANTGKFNSFTFVGSALSGGVSKRSLLATFPSSKYQRLCLGLVGSSKFCIKERLPGANSCGTGKHETSKYRQVFEDAFYVKHNEIQAYCQPVLHAKFLHEDQVEILMLKTLTLNDWGEVFEGISLGNLPDWLPKYDHEMTMSMVQNDVDHLSQASDLALKTLGILSPTKGEALDFNFQLSLSFDSTDSSILAKVSEEESEWRASVAPEELLKYVDLIHKRLKEVKRAWTKPFHEVESSYKLLVADLKTINENVSILHSQVGTPAQIKGVEGNSIWGALGTLAVAQSDLEAATEVMEDQFLTKMSDHLDQHAPFQQTLQGLERLEQFSICWMIA
jgi:hypothetical protein